MASKASTYKVQVKGNTVTTLNIALNPMIPFPVKIYSPYESASSSGLHKGCPKCLNKVDQPPICSNPDCEYHNGFPEHDRPILIAIEGTENLEITQEDLDGLDLLSNKEFQVLGRPVAFKDVEHLTYYATGLYYTAPENAVSAFLYHALLQNLKKTRRVIMGKFILKSTSRSENLGMLRVLGDCLVIQMVPFAEARRETPKFELPDITKQDEARLTALLDENEDEFAYALVRDNYQDALTELRQDKLRERMGKGKARRKKAASAATIAMNASARDQIEAMFGKVEVSKKAAKRPRGSVA